LQDREERFRKIFDISPIGIQLFSSEGVLINANQRSLNILGWKDSKHAKVPNLLRDALEDEDIRQKLLSGQTWHDGRWISLKPIKATKNKNDSQEGPGRTYIDYIITPLGKSGDPEGIAFVDCGQCGIGEAKKISEYKGYKFYIVPGSTFIKRIIKKYQPKAIVGVGCPMEIKEGLDLCHRYKLPAVGIALSKAGCVATKLDWEQFYKSIND